MTLKELRERTGLTQAQVAKKMFVCQSCVSHWESGDWGLSRKYHKKLAKLYGVSVEELMECRGQS